jgi:NAD(P)-dependent dehydrogenase (short-subunit alcohol dehydrogenase family)
LCVDHENRAFADRAENRDVRDRKEKAAKADKAEATDPIDAKEPTEPIESADPADPIDNTELSDPIESRESRDRTESLDAIPRLCSPITSPRQRLSRAKNPVGVNDGFMARIFVTGSADGLGRATADTLLTDGHDVIVHARNHDRARALSELVDRGAELVVADLSQRQEVLDAARQLDEGPAIDAVIHNAGVYSGASVIPVNVVAPYLFTALLRTPTRHVYLSSGMHRGGRIDLDRLDWDGHKVTGSYSDSKLLVTALALGVARRWAPDVLANAVNPGWVATKMGGAGAPDDFDLGHETQDRLATDQGVTVSGGYWFHGQQQEPHPAARDATIQDNLLDALAEATGVELTRR